MTPFSDAHLAQLSAEDSGRYSFGAQKIVLTRVHLTRRGRRLVSRQLCRANPNPLELLVGAKTDSWLVQAHEDQR